MAQNGPEDEHEGASQAEILIEACRRNNTDLLTEVLESFTDPEKLATFLNTTTTVLGNYAYHEAAANGNHEIIDVLLDQEGFECDPINKREGDTPLHSAVRWINEEGERNWEYGANMVEMMIEAGSDPRIRNKAKLKPFDLVDPRNTELREKLQQGEYVLANQGDFIDVEEQEAEDEATGSNSDSDFDEDKGGK